MNTGSVFVIGTMDTKGAELEFVAGCLRDSGVAGVQLCDVSTSAFPPVGTADVLRETIAAAAPRGVVSVMGKSDRGEAVSAMSEALVHYFQSVPMEKIAGVIGLGGTGGTALLSPAFRSLPVGTPKLIVSTVASGNTKPYVGTSDLLMMNSVVDVAGLNRVSKTVLANAAHALAGMVRHRQHDTDTRPAAGMTMFGVTTPCVSAVRERIEDMGWDALVFHATGTGGQSMEALARSGMISGLLDLTTTEVADEVVGGVFAAGPDRFLHLAQTSIPCVLSVGALDMVNFGEISTVPEQFRDRKIYKHNAQVTLMRTTPEENRAFAQWMIPRINRSLGPVTLLLPEHGISMLDAPGQPFHDPEADAALFDEIEKLFEPTETHHLIRLPLHINDPAFAERAFCEFQSLITNSSQ